MTDDVIDAWNEIDDHGDLMSLNHFVHYNPRQFAAQHPAPTLEEFALDEEGIESWGRRCTIIRQ